ncbi:MAG: ATP-binding cassette domain-containing protein [Acidimicrobiales bacterium]
MCSELFERLADAANLEDRHAENARRSSGEDVLEAVSVSKRYPGVQALSDVSLTVRRGEVHGLVGENGAGKSTLVGIASGAVAPEEGEIWINGARAPLGDPDWAREHGLAIVYQEPALLPDLTVAENVRLGMPDDHRPPVSDQLAYASQVLESWSGIAQIDPRAYVRDLAPLERFIVEIARAVAEVPTVLILDEPTEHLPAAGVEELFLLIGEVCNRGGSVVYISHRIREVKAVADRVSVLRDGELVTTGEASELSESDIVDLIVGRRLEARFPSKASTDDLGPVRLRTEGLSGQGFSDIDLEVRAGEIVGLAGIEGQGQRELLRALAGLQRSVGTVHVDGKGVRLRTSTAAVRHGIVYLAHDRHREGVLPNLGVRENAAAGGLSQWATAGFMVPRRERPAVRAQLEEVKVKTPSLETAIDDLSGGNQQKVMFSRALLNGSAVFLADEPTQGVDVGARADLYEMLRTAAAEGMAVIVVSADSAELEGLCDRVLVVSRGQIAGQLTGDDVVERSITEAALTATTVRKDRELAGAFRQHWFMRLLRSDFAPSFALIPALIVLGIIATNDSEFYLTQQNFSLTLPLAATLALFAMGQQLVMMTGAIDLSIGPLAGLQVVIASFMLDSGVSTAGWVGAILVLLGVAVLVASVNWLLTDLVRINPLIATLVTFGALQGVSLLLRPTPGGSITDGLTDAMKSEVWFIPAALIAAVVLAIGLELALYRTMWGMHVRGAGSDRIVAAKVGISPSAMLFLTFLGAALFATLASFMLMAQVRGGNASVGNGFTLSSVGAVVLGGASIHGGRGSLLGALMGALLITQINTVVQFLGWGREWQLYLLGGLTIAAAASYSLLRSR